MTDRTAPSAGIDPLLADLRADGCNLLVTGAVPQEVTYHATRVLFGADREQRERLLACTDLEPDPDHYLRNGYRGGPTTVAADGLQRSVATTEPSAELPTDSRLHPFQARLCEAIAEAVERRGGFEPAQLRLGVVTLRPIVERFGTAESRRFLRVITTLVDGVDGLGHYHLPVEDGDDLVAAYDDLFDARIELRKRERTPPEHRFHLPTETTEWWPL